MNQDVGPRDEPLQLAAIACVIERDAPLVGVEVEEEPACFAIRLAAWKRPTRSRGIARGRLDLDHVGAEVGHELRAVGGGNHLTELENAETFESLHGRSSLPAADALALTSRSGCRRCSG